MDKSKKDKKSLKQTKSQILIVATALAIFVAAAILLIVNFSDTKAPAQPKDDNKTAVEKDDSKEKSPEEAFVTLTNEKFETLLNAPAPFFVYIGRPTCPHCAAFAPILAEVVTKNNKTVYYFDTADARVADAEKMSSLLGIVEITSVPALIKVSNGAKIATLDNRENKEIILQFLNN